MFECEMRTHNNALLESCWNYKTAQSKTIYVNSHRIVFYHQHLAIVASSISSLQYVCDRDAECVCANC